MKCGQKKLYNIVYNTYISYLPIIKLIFKQPFSLTAGDVKSSRSFGSAIFLCDKNKLSELVVIFDYTTKALETRKSFF